MMHLRLPTYGLPNALPLGRCRHAVRAIALAMITFVAGSTLTCDMMAQDAEASADRLRRVQRDFKQNIRPILEETCGDCHWGDNDDAGVNLEPFESIDQLLDARKLWRKVLTRVAAREMPPEDSQPLTDDQHEQVVAWVDDLLNSVDCSNINAGRVTIRRLNRTEYQNTIRDLLGVDYEPAADFPGDDVGYGFDNIADVLSLPPRLLEKYLSAAEHITTRAVVDRQNGQYRKRILARQFKKSKASDVLPDGSHAVYSNGGITHAINVPFNGQYRVTVSAVATQAGDEPTRMGVGIYGQPRREVAVPESGKELRDYSVLLNLNAGSQRLEVSLVNDLNVKPRDGQPTQDRNLFVVAVELAGPLNYEGTFVRRYLADLPTEKPAQAKFVKQLLQSFASHAWRRPVTDRELRRLFQLYRRSARGEATPVDGLRVCVQAILISPNFLFKFETPVALDEPVADSTADAGGATKPGRLTDHQLATRLSYFLWSTMPDEELFAVAAEGTLITPVVLKQQIQRMLADPKADALVDNFAAQWLQLPKLEKVRPDPDQFPGIDATMRQAMATETKLLIKDLIDNDASVLSLLDADYSFVNERLAKHYGIDSIHGDQFQKVSLAGARRSGIISHASILTLTSNPTRTSPVKRGKWIMENLLGDEPPPPDPDAMPLEDQAELTGTTRERMIQHREDPNCAVCHLVMDELGFALENFDAVGRWRDTDEGEPVDARGELPDGTTFEGAAAMQAVIAGNMKAKFVRCLTEKMLIYALGRGLEYYDECTIDEIIERTSQRNYRFSELVTQVILSKPFRETTTAGPPRLKPEP